MRRSDNFLLQQLLKDVTFRDRTLQERFPNDARFYRGLCSHCDRLVDYKFINRKEGKYLKCLLSDKAVKSGVFIPLNYWWPLVNRKARYNFIKSAMTEYSRWERHKDFCRTVIMAATKQL